MSFRIIRDPLVSILILLFSATLAQALSTDPKEVDLNPAFTFKGYPVSNYILAKNRNRDLPPTDATPSERELSEWLLAFLAKQALIAELRLQKTHLDPDIVAKVEAMENYLLLQEDGPLFSSFFPVRTEFSNTDPAKRNNMLSSVHGSFLRLPSDSPLLADRRNISRLLQQESTHDTLHDDSILITNSSLAWPFHPFMKIRDDISVAPLSRLHGPITADGNVFFFNLQDRHTDNSPYANRPDAFFDEYASYIERTLDIQHFRFDLLETAKLTVNRVSLENAFHALVSRKNGLVGLKQTIDPAYPLFSYTDHGNVREVKLRDLIAFHNNSVDRSPIHSPSNLLQNAKKFVLTQLLRQLAHEQGIFDSPRFLQNRLNFENNCLIEQHKAHYRTQTPPPSDSELQAAYQSHFLNRRTIEEIEGVIEFYDSPKHLSENLPPQRISESIRIQKSSTSNRIDIPSEILLSLADGETSPPFISGSQIAVFRKTATTQARAIPFNELIPEISDFLFERTYAQALQRDLRSRCFDLNFQSFVDLPPFLSSNSLNPLLPTTASQNPSSPRQLWQETKN